VPQEWELQEPQPPLDLVAEEDEEAEAPCPTSWEMPPERRTMFQMRLELELPQASQAGSTVSDMERSMVKTWRQSRQR
jgi:hypothetical protein